MASSKPKIFLSDLAPAESVHFTFADAEFDLSGKKTFDPTTDADGKDVAPEVTSRIIGEAINHPWLSVDVPVIAPEVPADADTTDEPGTAIEAGLNQTTPVETAGVAETLAADDTTKTSEKVS